MMGVATYAYGEILGWFNSEGQADETLASGASRLQIPYMDKWCIDIREDEYGTDRWKCNIYEIDGDDTFFDKGAKYDGWRSALIDAKMKISTSLRDCEITLGYKGITQ